MAVAGHRHDLIEGLLDAGEALALEAETDGLVVFGDGMEADRLTLAWGQRITVRAAEQSLRLVLAEPTRRAHHVVEQVRHPVALDHARTGSPG